MAGIAASEAGIAKAKIALTDKGWSRQDLADRVLMGEGKSLQIGISIQTVNNFFTTNRVKPQYFVGICKALELNWQEIKESNATKHGGSETGFFHENTSLQSTDLVRNPVSSMGVDNYDHNNPFIPKHGKIDDPRFFFGREREIRRVFETLNSGSSIAIIGERAIGKSSLLQAIYREVPNQLRYARQPIYIDLQIVCDEDDCSAIICKCAQNDE